MGTFNWCISNVYLGMVECSVPIFVMISGTLFLGKNPPIKRIFTKSILRIVIAYIVWSVIYAFWSNFVIYHNYNIKGLLTTILFGHYHLWFLFMIIGLYIIVPFLSILSKNRRIAIYFIVVSLVFAYSVPELIQWVGTINNAVSELFENFVSKIDFHLALGYSGYFLLGYLINTTNIKKKYQIIIYTLGIIALIFSVGSSFVLSNKADSPMTISYGSFTIENFLVSVSVFVFAKTVFSKPLFLSAQKLIVLLSKCSFGVYLVHPLIIESFELFDLSAMSFNPLFSIPILSVLVFLISLLISILLNKIPFIKKWIV